MTCTVYTLEDVPMYDERMYVPTKLRRRYSTVFTLPTRVKPT